jgi:hypothetical protein
MGILEAEQLDAGKSMIRLSEWLLGFQSHCSALVAQVEYQKTFGKVDSVRNIKVRRPVASFCLGRTLIGENMI